jgi:hypothetical protein
LFGKSAASTIQERVQRGTVNIGIAKTFAEEVGERKVDPISTVGAAGLRRSRNGIVGGAFANLTVFETGRHICGVAFLVLTKNALFLKCEEKFHSFVFENSTSSLLLLLTLLRRRRSKNFERFIARKDFALNSL